MKKLLSLCIPSYNMEKYLDRCLSSLLIDEILPLLEIIIVNDGSKDKTLEIAKRYVEKYPNFFVVINKQNGHYGSTVNASLKIATGKYFKILDADDWFEQKSLIEFVTLLNNINTDCIFTRKSVHNVRDNTVKEQECNGVVWNKIINLDKEYISENMLSMHSLCYKTAFLRKIGYYQTEGICYTDTEYVYFPLCQAKTLYCINVSLYQYFLGRSEQSMAYQSMQKNYDHFRIILERIMDHRYDGNNNSKLLYYHYVVVLLRFMLLTHLLLNHFCKERDEDLRGKILSIKREEEGLFEKILSIKIKKIPYVKLWYEKRWEAPIFLSFLRVIFNVSIHVLKPIQN